MKRCEVCRARIDEPRYNQKYCDSDCRQEAARQKREQQSKAQVSRSRTPSQIAAPRAQPTAGEVLAGVLVAKAVGWVGNKVMKSFGLHNQAEEFKKTVDEVVNDAVRDYHQARQADQKSAKQNTTQPPQSQAREKVSKAYDKLGLKDGSTVDEVNKRLRELAAQLHPDRNKDPEAEKKFAEFAAAAEVIKEHFRVN